MSSAPARYSSRHLAYLPAQAEIHSKIRSLHAEGMTISELTERFGLSYPTVWKVVNNFAKEKKK
jgi:Mor family transcriptional regulator